MHYERQARRFTCGVAALFLDTFVSLNAAGRRHASNRSTGENDMRRTVTTRAWPTSCKHSLLLRPWLPDKATGTVRSITPSLARFDSELATTGY